MISDLHLPHADSRLLQTEGGSSPPDLTPASQQGLPEDLLQEAAHRLGAVALIVGGLWLANLVVVHLLDPMAGHTTPGDMRLHLEWIRVFDVVGGAALLLSVALFWYTSAQYVDPGFCSTWGWSTRY